MAAPVVASIVPASGSSIGAADYVAFDVTSAPVLLKVIIWAEFVGMALKEVVYDGTAPAATYNSCSITTIAGGFRYSVRRDPLWPDEPRLTVYAVNTAAEETTVTMYWTLQYPASLPSPGAIIPVFPAGPGAGASANSGAILHDQAYFLAMFERVLDAEYLRPITTVAGGGYEIYKAFADVGARVSSAICNLEVGSLAQFAPGGAYALGTVELYRNTAGAGAVTVKAGSIVMCSKSGRKFITLADAVFAVGALGPVAVQARAMFQGYNWNVPGLVVTKAGIPLQGEIDTAFTLYESPDYGDNTIRVRQVLATAGGADPMLDGLGHDRGVTRQDGETDDQLRFRIRSLPDVVTPTAIRAAAKAIMSQYASLSYLIEPFNLSFQTCWDAPSGGVPTTFGFSSTRFVYDDTRDPLPRSNRWIDETTCYHAFIVEVQNIEHQLDLGLAYDDTAMTATAILAPKTAGTRSSSAYDVPSSYSAAPAGAYDGDDYRKNSVYKGLWDTLNNSRAAGVAAYIELQGE